MCINLFWAEQRDGDASSDRSVGGRSGHSDLSSISAWQQKTSSQGILSIEGHSPLCTGWCSDHPAHELRSVLVPFSHWNNFFCADSGGASSQQLMSSTESLGADLSPSMRRSPRPHGLKGKALHQTPSPNKRSPVPSPVRGEHHLLCRLLLGQRKSVFIPV